MEQINKHPYIFDRRRHSHPWESSLRRLQSDNHPENTALAQNWRMDHRVSEQREDELSTSSVFPSSKNPTGDFSRAIRDYFQTRLCIPAGTHGSTAPAYAIEANRDNRIAREQISPNQPLVHIVSLNTVLPRILRDFDTQDALYRLTGDYPPEPEDLTPAHVETIAGALMAQGEDAIREFAGLLSDQLGPTEPHWWAAFAFELDDYLLDDDWTEAARVLGLGHLRQGQWLIGWRYSPELAGPLYRPSVAEVGLNGHHFPSPPGENLGITMPLEATLPAVKEVVHAPLKGNISVEACMGRLGRIAQPLITTHTTRQTEWLALRREKHAAHLHEHYEQKAVGNWLTRHGLNR